MSKAKIKITVSCGETKREVYCRTSFFNNGIALKNQFCVLHAFLQDLVKPGYLVKVGKASGNLNDHMWYSLEDVLRILPLIRLSRTVYEKVLVKPAWTQVKDYDIRMPEGIKVEETWINEYGDFEGFTFIRVVSKFDHLKPVMTEVRDKFAETIGCKVGIGINNTLWISPSRKKITHIQRFNGYKADLICFTEEIHHPAEYKIVKRAVPL